MIRYLILTCSFLIVGKIGHSQNTISIGEKAFHATDTWQFEISVKNLEDSTLKVIVAKGINGSGYLSLSMRTDKSAHIGNEAILYLAFNTILRLPEPFVIDRLNNNSKVIYKIDSVGYRNLKYLQIKTIRFNMVSSSGAEAYTAENSSLNFKSDKKNKSGTMNFGVQTHDEIKELDELR